MNKILLYILSIAALIVLTTSSCENDVDINDEYKEIGIVYGLLDFSETQHYIKLTKAFQTEGNVYLAAADEANSQYDPKDIEMYIEVYNRYGDFLRDITLDTVLITNKDTGAFFFPNQLVYATAANVSIHPSDIYKLRIKNLVNGNLIESETNLVQDFSIVKPRAILKLIDFSSKYPTHLEWHSAVNGKLYQVTMRYYYTDIPASGPTVSHRIDWVLPTRRSERTDGKEKVSLDYAGLGFYDLLKSEVPLPEPGMKRYSDSVEYVFTVAHENFSIYLDVNKPSTSVVQERPAFSNIGNGIGLFSSRYNKIRPFAGLTPKSLDSLYNGSKTYNLGFVDRPFTP